MPRDFRDDQICYLTVDRGRANDPVTFQGVIQGHTPDMVCVLIRHDNALAPLIEYLLNSTVADDVRSVAWRDRLDVASAVSAALATAPGLDIELPRYSREQDMVSMARVILLLDEIERRPDPGVNSRDIATGDFLTRAAKDLISDLRSRLDSRGLSIDDAIRRIREGKDL